MNRLLATLILAVTILVAQSADAAPKRAYKPAEARNQEAEAQAASAQEGSAATNYERELQAARAERDKKLESLDQQAMDRRTLEKRKTEIFAEYARILAAMRDKYEASNPPPTPAPTERTTKRKPTRSTGTARATPPPAPPRNTRSARSNGRAGQDTKSALADAERKLQEENDRHAARMEDLNAQLRQAESFANKREVRRVQKAIEKENNTYNAKRPILERRVVELGGAVRKPSAEARVRE